MNKISCVFQIFAGGFIAIGSGYHGGAGSWMGLAAGTLLAVGGVIELMSHM